MKSTQDVSPIGSVPTRMKSMSKGVFSFSTLGSPTHILASSSMNSTPFSTGQIAAQLYERKCGERGIGVNALYKERLQEIGSPLLPITETGHVNGGECCLSFAGLSVDVSFEVVLDLLLMSTSSDVTALDCSRMGLTDDHVEALANTLLRSPKIQSVNLSDNREITDKGGMQLLMFLKQRKKRGTEGVRELNISDTSIGPLIAQQIFSELPSISHAAKVQQPTRTLPSAKAKSASGPTGDQLDRAVRLANLVFTSAHRVLSVFCWDPPLRTLTWFALCLSMGISGATVETAVLAFILAVWHRKFSAAPPMAHVKFADYLSPTTPNDSGGDYNFFVTWRNAVEREVLLALSSGDDLLAREGLFRSFDIVESVILKLLVGSENRKGRMGCLFLITLLFALIPPSYIFVGLCIILFLWTPIWAVLLGRMLEGFSVHWKRAVYSLAVLRGKVPTPVEPGDLSSLQSPLRRKEPIGTSVGIRVTLDALENESRNLMLPFNPQISVSVGGSTWLSPCSTPEMFYEWGHPAGTTPLLMLPSEATVESRTMSFTLVEPSISGEVSAIARGFAMLDTVMLDHLAKTKHRGVGLKVKLQPLQRNPTLIQGLLASVLASEDADRERYNVPLQGLSGGDLSFGVLGQRALEHFAEPLTLFVRLQVVDLRHRSQKRGPTILNETAPE